MTTEINIDGITYRSAPEIDSCKGCVFEHSDVDCDKITYHPSAGGCDSRSCTA